MNFGILNQLSDLFLLLARQFNIQSTQILLKILDLLCSRDGDDIITLSKQPSEGKLPRCASLLLGEVDKTISQLEILGKVLF